MKRSKLIIGVFVTLGLLSILSLTNLKFSFDFEQFFPTGDKELDFYKNFRKEFEADDNFLLVAIGRKDGVFDSSFLAKVHDFTLKARDLPNVTESQSLTKIEYPIKTPFAITTIPVIHLDDPSQYAADKKRILQDERFRYAFIDDEAKTLVVFLKTTDAVMLPEATKMVNDLDAMLKPYNFEETHYLGRAYFQKEIVEMEKFEVALSTLVAGILVTFVMAWIFKRFWGAVIALSSILLALLIFLGILSVTGREMTALSALYPVLMLILGTFDVIHIMSKYIDEVKKGHAPAEAVRITIKEMSLATFLTYSTTAIGFLTLLYCNIVPIQDFGINATIGVTVAYVVAIVFTPAFLSFFTLDQIVKIGKETERWNQLFEYLHKFTWRHPKAIALATCAVLGLCFWGISMITTNYRIEGQLPKGGRVTGDFLYFEKVFAGFRPFEFAILPKGDRKAQDFEVVNEMDKIERHLHTIPSVRAINSITSVYKSIHEMSNGNNPEAYVMPNKEQFESYAFIASKLPKTTTNILLSKDKKKARIATRIADLGADSVKAVGYSIDRWIKANIDTNIMDVHRTGTGLLLDKNSEYVRDQTIYGMLWSVMIISILMAFILKDWRMIIIFLIPNLFPLIICGAFMGFWGIELEAGISIVFSVIFGIAVDDTIHTLSKFKIYREKGLNVDESLRETLLEVGKPMFQTAIILFFGFLVMLFSATPTSVHIGLLMSFTLASALLSDLFMLPVLVRFLVRDKK
jgi:predicted RND superfamily exporter protein